MKAFRAARLAGVSALAVEEAPEPSAGPEEIVIRVQAACVHLADVAAAAGDRRPRPATPFTPGIECAGTIAALGNRVKGLAVGDKVTAFLPWGGLAEQARTRAELAAKLGPGTAMAGAAMLPVAYAGALMAFQGPAGLRADETVLVLGAGGLAGLAAIEIAKKLEARVLAVASGEERLSRAQDLADATIDAGSLPLEQEVRRLTDGKGADLVFDPVGGQAMEAAQDCLAQGARIICTGFASGRPARLNAAALFARGAQLMSVNFPFFAERHPELAREALTRVVAWAADGGIHPHVAAKFALNDAARAFEYISGRRGQGGVVVTID